MIKRIIKSLKPIPPKALILLFKQILLFGVVYKLLKVEQPRLVAAPTTTAEVLGNVGEHKAII